MKININPEIRSHKAIHERIKAMSLSHEVSHTHEKVPTLQEGKVEVCGVENINEYLNDLQQELHFWYYGNC